MNLLYCRAAVLWCSSSSSRQSSWLTPVAPGSDGVGTGAVCPAPGGWGSVCPPGAAGNDPPRPVCRWQPSAWWTGTGVSQGRTLCCINPAPTASNTKKTNVCLCATNKTNQKLTQLWHWTTTVVLWQWVLLRGNTAYPLFVLKCPHSVTVQQSHKLSWVKVTTGLQHNTFLISYLQRLRIHYFSAFQCLKFHHKIQEY